MNQDVIGIREMCDRFGVTPRTLRFYESKELLFPRREGVRRLYGRRDRARMALILRGKRYGLSLETIRGLLDLYDLPDGPRQQLVRTRAVAVDRLAELERERAELDLIIADLRADIDKCSAALKSPDAAAEVPCRRQNDAA